MILLAETLVILLVVGTFQQSATNPGAAWLAGFTLAMGTVWALVVINACVGWLCDQLDPTGGR